MGGKSGDCSEGEQPDTVGNAPHPITPGPNRGLRASVTAVPQPEEPLYAPYRGANAEYRKHRRPNIWQREVTQDEVAWRLARVSGRGGILDMSSLGLAQMQLKYESRDSLDGKLE